MRARSRQTCRYASPGSWTNIANWVDPPAEFELDGPFAPGSRGTTRIPGQAPMSWVIRDVQPEIAFTTEVVLEGASFLAHRRFEALPHGRTRVTVTPRGGLLLCEDAAGNQFTEGERLIGLTLQGETFTFAMNNVVLATDYNARVGAGDYRQAEWAGACYSPDGRWLFVNIQTPGITFAITGPWGRGPL